MTKNRKTISMRTGHSERLARFFANWTSWSLKEWPPNWWLVRPPSRAEFRANQRLLGKVLILAGILAPAYGALVDGGIREFLKHDAPLLVFVTAPLFVGGVMLLRRRPR